MTTEKHIINKLNLRFNRKLFIKIIEYISEVKILKVNNYVNILNHLGKISNDDIDFIIEFHRPRIGLGSWRKRRGERIERGRDRSLDDMYIY